MTDKVEHRRSRLAILFALHRDLLLWALRRRVRADGLAFSTMKSNTVWPFVLLVTFLTPLEVGAVELLVPAQLWWIRLPLAILAAWGLLLTWALYASLVRNPLVVGRGGLELRWGALMRYLLPFKLIEAVWREERRHPTGQFGLVFHPPGKDKAWLSQSSGTSVTLTLRHPVVLPTGWLGGRGRASVVHLGVEDPAGFIEAMEAGIRETKPDDSDAGPATEPASRSSSGTAIVLLSLGLELVLGILGYFWIEQQGRNVPQAVAPSLDGFVGGLAMAAVMLLVTVGVYQGLAGRFGPLRAWRRWTEEQLIPFVAPLGTGAMLVVALSAGIGEEMFFRGAMQPAFGLVPAAVIFALAHVGGFIRREAVPLLLFTLLWGLAAGVAYERIDALWPLIVAHATFDFGMLLYLRAAPK